MAIKTPLSHVKDKFGDKAKLVQALEKLANQDLWVARTNKDKGLAHVSNAKLLRLHATFTEVKEKFGTRDKLVDALLAAEGRAKDTGFRERVSDWPVPRLFDAYKSAVRRSGAPRGEQVTEAPVAKAAKSAKAPAKAEAKAAAKAAAPKAGKKTEKAAKK